MNLLVKPKTNKTPILNPRPSSSTTTTTTSAIATTSAAGAAAASAAAAAANTSAAATSSTTTASKSTNGLSLLGCYSDSDSDSWIYIRSIITSYFLIQTSVVQLRLVNKSYTITTDIAITSLFPGSIS